ncbi:MAG: HAD-IA family hydrolase [Halioglobus sp.]
MIIIFDWDGTLCDSVDHIVLAMQQAAVSIGVPVPEPAAVRDIVGLGLQQAIARVFPGRGDEFGKDFAALYSRHYIEADQPPATLFNGALSTLNSLKGRGIELAVATGKSRRGLDRVLSGLNLSEFFQATRCADETLSKPHPLMLEEILRERGKSPEQALMVGDTEYDLEMATNAGVASVGVSFGVHSIERLMRHQPVAILDELAGLLNIPQCQAREPVSTG